MKKLILLLVLLLGFNQNLFAVSTALCSDTDTKLLLHMDGADGSTTFTDSSSGAKTVTRNGGAIETDQSKFGGASGLFVSAGTDYLSLADSADWVFGSGDFTIEFWQRFVGARTHNDYDQFVDSSNYVLMGLKAGTYKFEVKSGGSTLANYTFSWSPSDNTWYHIAITRSGTTFRIFIDGTSQTLTTGTAISTNSLPDLAADMDIGYSNPDGNSLNGYYDEYRVVKGTAVYTANFTPPTAAYSDTCGNRRKCISVN